MGITHAVTRNKNARVHIPPKMSGIDCQQLRCAKQHSLNIVFSWQQTGGYRGDTDVGIKPIILKYLQ